MDDQTEQRLRQAKNLVDDVLAGRVTPESRPAAFDDDLVYLSVRIAEVHARDWLLERLVDTHPAPNVQRVLECMAEPPSWPSSANTYPS